MKPKNWNTNTRLFKSQKDKKIWEISQFINYGLSGNRLKEKEIKLYWKDLKPLLDPERARMIEYIVWKKVYSLPTNSKFWNLSPKTNL